LPIIDDGNKDTQHTDGYCWAYKDMWVARKGKWKLLGNPYDTSNRDYNFIENRFLVNLDNDLGETSNVANKYPAIVLELEKQYEKWLKNNSK
jgi:hypothetical protein